MQTTRLIWGFGGPGPLQKDAHEFSLHFEFGEIFFGHVFDAFMTIFMFFYFIFEKLFLQNRPKSTIPAHKSNVKPLKSCKTMNNHTQIIQNH